MLPISNYKLIDITDRFQDSILLRNTPNQEYRDQITSELKGDMIASPNSTAELLRYSLSILSIYKSSDTKLKVNDPQKLYHVEWQPGENGRLPRNKYIEKKPDAGALFYTLKELQELRPTYKAEGGKQNRTLVPKIMHKPTKCNFWHFEVFWLDDNGKDISELSGNWLKRAASGVRTSLKYVAREPHSEVYYELLEEDYRS